MTILQKKLETSIGGLYLVASDKGLQHLSWKKQQAPMLKNEKEPATIILKKAEKQIKEYLAGSRKVFDLPLDVNGTDFQKKVWAALLKIPYGKTCSYKDIAVALNNSKACRAVGTANGRNPISIIVPCHRVINADGGLGGYSSGLSRKKILLKLECL
ncbi:MAG: methylated-DNA--[protein]-cysteine S-methyltransferase [Gammaproteobacteria bacterium]